MVETLAPDVQNFLAKEQSIKEAKKPIADKMALPTIEGLPKPLVEISEKIADISGSWNPVEIYTADASSIDEERGKVFAALDTNTEYNPKLTYSYANTLDLTQARKELDETMHKLRQQKIDKKDRASRLFRAALYFKIKDDLATCDLVEGIKAKDEDKISVALKQKYPGTDPTLMSLAQVTYEQEAREGEAKNKEGQGLLSDAQKDYIKGLEFDAPKIKDAFEYALKEYNILWSDSNPDGFKVKIDKNATSIDVRDKSANGPTIFIPEDRKMNGKTLLGLISHEIERHAVQSVNGWRLFRVGGGRLKIDNEQLYEGLGLRGETDSDKELFGVEGSTPRPYYPLAVKMAEDGASFFKIFKDQFEKRLHVVLKVPHDKALPQLSTLEQKTIDTAKRNAWLTTYRVMRGHTDMSNKKKYAMAKDLGYMRGYQIDHQLLKNDRGHLNEAAVIASGGLQMLAEFNISPNTLPIPFKNVTKQYCMEVLLPQMPQAS